MRNNKTVFVMFALILVSFLFGIIAIESDRIRYYNVRSMIVGQDYIALRLACMELMEGWKQKQIGAKNIARFADAEITVYTTGVETAGIVIPTQLKKLNPYRIVIYKDYLVVDFGTIPRTEIFWFRNMTSTKLEDFKNHHAEIGVNEIAEGFWLMGGASRGVTGNKGQGCLAH